MWVEFHDKDGRVQIEDMTPDGIHDAIYQCERVTEELESAARALEPDEDEDAVRQTACRFCGQDIEGFAPYPAGEWRDRGNNTTCPTPEGDAGRKHAPVDED